MYRLLRAMSDAIEPLGWHAGAAGSVMIEGESTSDLDVLVYPHRMRKTLDVDAALRLIQLRTALSTARMRLIHDHATTRAERHSRGCDDEKVMEKWEWRGYSVNVLVFGVLL